VQRLGRRLDGLSRTEAAENSSIPQRFQNDYRNLALGPLLIVRVGGVDSNHLLPECRLLRFNLDLHLGVSGEVEVPSWMGRSSASVR